MRLNIKAKVYLLMLIIYMWASGWAIQSVLKDLSTVKPNLERILK